jgi:hypothetical protein
MNNAITLVEHEFPIPVHPNQILLPKPNYDLKIVNMSGPTSIEYELLQQKKSFYLCSMHTRGFHRVENRFLLALANKTEFDIAFEEHFSGYIKIGKKGNDADILKSKDGNVLAVIRKVSRQEHDLMKTYLETCDFALLEESEQFEEIKCG